MQNPYVVNEIQLSYKCHAAPETMPKVFQAEQAYHIFMGVWDDALLDLQEQGKVLFLNRASRVLGVYHLSTGGLASTLMDTRLILVGALKSNAASIILAHNHPSGNLKPSEADRILTNKFNNACELLEIKMNDHIIVARNGYYSFTEEAAYQQVQRNSNIYYERMMPF